MGEGSGERMSQQNTKSDRTIFVGTCLIPSFESHKLLRRLTTSAYYVGLPQGAKCLRHSKTDLVSRHEKKRSGKYHIPMFNWWKKSALSKGERVERDGRDESLV